MVEMSHVNAKGFKRLTGSDVKGVGLAFFAGCGALSSTCFLFPSAFAEGPGVCEAGVYAYSKDRGIRTNGWNVPRVLVCRALSSRPRLLHLLRCSSDPIPEGRRPGLASLEGRSDRRSRATAMYSPTLLVQTRHLRALLYPYRRLPRKVTDSGKHPTVSLCNPPLNTVATPV